MKTPCGVIRSVRAALSHSLGIVPKARARGIGEFRELV
jgi:hypothetical protein